MSVEEPLIIRSFKVGKGRSRESGDGSWLKEYFEIEGCPAEPGENAFQNAIARAEYIIDNLLQSPETVAPKQATPATPQPRITMAPTEIDESMPWIASKWVRASDNDRKAKPFEDAWQFEDKCDPRLLRMLQEGHGQLELPPYTFAVKELRDSGTKIISRRGPKSAKEKQAKK